MTVALVGGTCVDCLVRVCISISVETSKKHKKKMKPLLQVVTLWLCFQVSTIHFPQSHDMDFISCFLRLRILRIILHLQCVPRSWPHGTHINVNSHQSHGHLSLSVASRSFHLPTILRKFYSQGQFRHFSDISTRVRTSVQTDLTSQPEKMRTITQCGFATCREWRSVITQKSNYIVYMAHCRVRSGCRRGGFESF